MIRRDYFIYKVYPNPEPNQSDIETLIQQIQDNNKNVEDVNLNNIKVIW